MGYLLEKLPEITILLGIMVLIIMVSNLNSKIDDILKEIKKISNYFQ